MGSGEESQMPVVVDEQNRGRLENVKGKHQYKQKISYHTEPQNDWLHTRHIQTSCEAKI
jgi:hypothetical protein